MTPLSLLHTGLGYEYFRSRTGGDDQTVYVHQLTAILAGEDPYRVFSPNIDVHHDTHIPWDNRPDNLFLEESRDHRVAHLEGRDHSAEMETAPKDPETLGERVVA